MVVMGVAGEVAATEASGPGSFQVRFLDALATLSEAELVSRMQLTSD
jgi:hydroxyethylthiazole kinase